MLGPQLRERRDWATPGADSVAVGAGDERGHEVVAEGPAGRYDADADGVGAERLDLQ